MDVGGNDHPAARQFAANQLRFQFFALGDILHLFRDDALPRQMHLRNIASFGRMRAVVVSVRRGRRCFPLLNPAVAQSHRTPPQKPRSTIRDRKKRSQPRPRGLNSNYGTCGWARQLRAAETNAAVSIALMANHSCKAQKRPVRGSKCIRSAPSLSPDRQLDSAKHPARPLRPPPRGPTCRAGQATPLARPAPAP